MSLIMSLTFILTFMSRCHCYMKVINFVSVWYCSGSEDFLCYVNIIIIEQIISYTFLFFMVFINYTLFCTFICITHFWSAAVLIGFYGFLQSQANVVLLH
jgi:hypothetical protein